MILITETNRLPETNGLVLHDRLFPARYLAEIRPDRPVENMVPEDFKRRVGCINRQRLVTHIGNRVDHQRQRSNVIEMGMRYEYMIDHCQFGKRKIGNSRTRVNQDIVVDEHRGRPQMAPSDSSAASENSDFHLVSGGLLRQPLNI